MANQWTQSAYFCVLLGTILASCLPTEDENFYCSRATEVGFERAFQTMCHIVNVRMGVSCADVHHRDDYLDVEDLDFVTESLAKCGVSLSVHTGNNPKPSQKDAGTESRCVIVSVQADFPTLNTVNGTSEFVCTGMRASFKMERNDTNYRSNIVLKLTQPPEPVVREINGMLSFAQKQHFIISVVPAVSWQNRIDGPNGTFTYTGINLEIVNTLAESLNFSYELVETPDGQLGGAREDGTWTGMIGQILNQEIDIGVADFTITQERSSVVTFLAPFWQEDTGFLVKVMEEDNLTLYIHPFKTELWYVTLASVIFAALVIKFFDFTYLRKENITKEKRVKITKPAPTYNYLLNGYRYMINQGSDKEPQKPASRLFLSCYWVLTITIIATYTGNLIAFMTVTRLTVPIDTLEDLAASSYDAGLLRGSSHHTLFRSATPGIIYKDVWDNNIDTNPNNLYTNYYHEMIAAIRRVQTEDFVFISDATFLQQYLLQEGICNVRLAKDRFFRSNYGFPVSKDFPFIDVFNNGIDGILSAGLLKRWMKLHLPKSDKECDKSLSSVGHTKATLKDTIGAYIALAVGISAAIVALVLEMIVKRITEEVSKSDLRQRLKDIKVKNKKAGDLC